MWALNIEKLFTESRSGSAGYSVSMEAEYPLQTDHDNIK